LLFLASHWLDLIVAGFVKDLYRIFYASSSFCKYYNPANIVSIQQI